MDSHIYEYAHLVSSWFLNFTASMTHSFDETEDALFDKECSLDSTVHDDADIHNDEIKAFMHVSRKRFIEHLRGEVDKMFVSWQERSKGRDDSQDDSFDDGQEIMKQKILALLSVIK